MDKQFILSEIKRTAEENGGKSLGRVRFAKETGIKQSDWYGRFWARWSDAVIEAGLEPNKRQDAYDEGWIIEKFIGLARELGHFPTYGEVRMRERMDRDFPTHGVWARFGSWAELRAQVAAHCHGRLGYEDVLAICGPVNLSPPQSSRKESADRVAFGYVYLMKSGRHYKIGRSNAAGRREYELAIQLPERLKTVHTIQTDDPAGIEACWHKRFGSRRLNGEWFALDAADVKAFMRRKFM